MYCRFWILVLPIQLMACALSTHAIIWWKISWSVTYYTVWTWQFVINRLYRRYLCTSNVGQFCGMPFPWLRDHQSRSACASAFWKVRPILTKTPENLQFKTRALYHDLFTKWEGKIGKYLSQGLTMIPAKGSEVLVPSQIFSCSVWPYCQYVIYHTIFVELDWDENGGNFLLNILNYTC